MLVGILVINVGEAEKIEFYKDIIAAVTVLLQVVCYMFQFQTYLKFQGEGPQLDAAEKPRDLQMFTFWVGLEVLLLLSVIISNFMFLVTRAFKENTMTFKIKIYDEMNFSKKKQEFSDEAKDFLQANHIMMGVFQTFSTPMVISVFIINNENFSELHDVASDDEHSMLMTFTIIQVCQLIAIWVLNFLTCDHKNQRIAKIIGIFRVSMPLTILILTFTAVITMIVFASKGTLDDSYMRVWFIIYGLINGITLLFVIY